MSETPLYRYKIWVEYDGSRFHGWQRQRDLPTVQQTLEEAIEAFSQHKDLRLQVAGRTDTGVHALGQVAHADIEKDLDPFQFFTACNHFLKDSGISVLEVEKVSDDFHARFSAKARQYVYKIKVRRAPLAVDAHRYWRVHKSLDVAAMEKAAQHLLGTHDFTSFRGADCQAQSPIKTLDEIRFETFGEDEIYIWFKSKSFLHHQVRNMVGTLAQVGAGKWPVERVKFALEAQDRREGGPMAPADGLYLTDVFYEK